MKPFEFGIDHEHIEGQMTIDDIEEVEPAGSTTSQDQKGEESGDRPVGPPPGRRRMTVAEVVRHQLGR
jgi:hypothetical protein